MEIEIVRVSIEDSVSEVLQIANRHHTNWFDLAISKELPENMPESERSRFNLLCAALWDELMEREFKEALIDAPPHPVIKLEANAEEPRLNLGSSLFEGFPAWMLKNMQHRYAELSGPVSTF